jgi:periplasmic divalent cation tolerance protein
MENADRPVLIYATFPTLEEAKRVGSTLVSQRLAACVNVFPGMISIYQWKGAQAEDNEVAMIIKTRACSPSIKEPRARALSCSTRPGVPVLRPVCR